MQADSGTKMRTMKAAVVTKLKRVECQDVGMPESTRGLVLVKTTMASICGSDLHIAYMGWNVNKFPLPPGHPGHEAIGKVVDGGDTEFNNSQNVLTLPNVWKSRAFAEYQLIEPQYLLQNKLVLRKKLQLLIIYQLYIWQNFQQ